MIGVCVAVALALGADWRRLIGLGVALALPLPALVLVVAYCWRQRRPGLSSTPSFCDAVASELRAGAPVRAAVETAARSVGALEVADLAGSGASMSQVARAARSEFPEIGDELTAVLDRAQGLGVGPAALFDEMGSLALAESEVAREVSVAAAPAKAAGVVLVSIPVSILVITALRGGLDQLLSQPAQRAAALAGAGLAAAGLVSALLILKRSG